jgi:hypothetical protein
MEQHGFTVRSVVPDGWLLSFQSSSNASNLILFHTFALSLLVAPVTMCTFIAPDCGLFHQSRSYADRCDPVHVMQVTVVLMVNAAPDCRARVRRTGCGVANEAAAASRNR